MRGRAHLAAGADGLRSVDAVTLSCLQCHWNVADAEPARGLIRMASNHGTSAAGHPVASLYDQAAEFGGYRPRDRLSEDIRLPRGRVSCLSCHEGYSFDHGRLLNPARGLCLECHEL